MERPIMKIRVTNGGGFTQNKYPEGIGGLVNGKKFAVAFGGVGGIGKEFIRCVIVHLHKPVVFGVFYKEVGIVAVVAKPERKLQDNQ